MTDELEELREKTSRDDRLSETEEEDEDEEPVAYTPVEDVVLRENADQGVKTLREQTERGERVEGDDEPGEVVLSPYDELFDEDAETVDDPYCGNCDHVTFRKHNGEPGPHCSLHDLKTRLESSMVCEEYEPQTGGGG
ncbi:hypothetical protein EGH25_02940 [Haladaptatus sp. F3-133]|uniref:Cell division protein A C-terminal domain-containing protein n=1 Tax=Halorutilus salinus TaxID=2487751 RepID=A0A9Q4C2W3_9EURY|nr:hypothetical protein [Halorutilus salinus]MCX2818308.1 hypothetical protein [Halorutilus salinus]